jgi:hypothetical protein
VYYATATALGKQQGAFRMCWVYTVDSIRSAINRCLYINIVSATSLELLITPQNIAAVQLPTECYLVRPSDKSRLRLIQSQFRSYGKLLEGTVKEEHGPTAVRLLFLIQSRNVDFYWRILRIARLGIGSSRGHEVKSLLVRCRRENFVIMNLGLVRTSVVGSYLGALLRKRPGFAR